VKPKDGYDVLGISAGGKIESFNFYEKPRIRGIICSTNPINKERDSGVLSIQCNTKIALN
jgi:hypothetical protein